MFKHVISFQEIKPFLKYAIIELSIFVAYMQLSKIFTSIGGLDSQLFFFEIPFLFFMSFLLYFPWVEQRSLRYFIPVLFILTPYLCFDIFYEFLRRSPRPSDLQNAGTVFDFSVGLSFSVFLVFALFSIVLLVLIWQLFQKCSIKKVVSILGVKIFLLLLAIAFLSSGVFSNYLKTSYQYLPWSQKRTIKNNGRFASFIYYGYQEKSNFEKLKKYSSSSWRELTEKFYPGSVKNPVNIHVIVLESFIDPRLLKSVRFNHPPLADSIRPYLHQHKSFSHTISPVYGGGTAQAEFELLTGVRALSKIDSIEFNVLGGEETESLPSRLKQFGYTTIATIASDRGYYNSSQAYKSLGFDKIIFLKNDGDFKKDSSDEHIFDGDLLEYNLALMKKRKLGKPVFNYILGMYGHFPYNRNYLKRPDLVQTTHEDDSVQRIANQFFYRTKALGEYINALLAVDPNSIIYISSDHLPPILSKEICYSVDKYVNVSLLLQGGKPIRTEGRKYFEIPWLLWDILSEEKHERIFSDSAMEKCYFGVLVKSIAK